MKRVLDSAALRAPSTRLTSELIFRFIREYITVIDPRTKRPRPMTTYPTQEHFAGAVFDRTDADGSRIIRRALFGAPKKTGKSSWFAALMLAHLLLEYEVDKEITLFGWDYDQTAIIYQAAEGIVRRDARLSKLIKVEKSKMTYHDELGTHTLTRIARDHMGSHGGNPSLVVGDELWCQPDATMLSALSLSPVRLDPLMLFTSYAGYETDMVPGKPLYDLWLKLQPGAEPDPSFVGVWMTDQDALREVPWWNQRYIEEQARVLASEPGAFERLILNRWAQSSHGMFTSAEASGIFDLTIRPALAAA